MNWLVRPMAALGLAVLSSNTHAAVFKWTSTLHRKGMNMPIRGILAGGLVVTLLSMSPCPAHAVQIYSVSNACGSSLLGQPNPVGVSDVCSNGYGVVASRATSTPGSVAAVNSSSRTISSGVPVEGSASARYQESSVIFSWVGPGPAPSGPVHVSMNLDFSGNLGVGGGIGAISYASVDYSVVFNGQRSILISAERIPEGPYFALSGFGITGGDLIGGPGSNLFDVSLETNYIDVPLNTPIGIDMSLSVFTFARDDKSANATAEFGNTATFAMGRDVFNLPAGFTANAPGSFLINNRYVLPSNGVPEPGTLALLGLALAGLGFSRRKE